MVLDWGCCTGAFIRSSPDGYMPMGYDINPHAMHLDKTLVRFGYDAVTAFDVVEHMADPYAFMASLNTRYLFILVPDASTLKGNLGGWKHYRPDEHQHYFTKESLTRFMERGGFKIREMNHDEGKLRDPKHPGWLVTCVGERA